MGKLGVVAVAKRRVASAPAATLELDDRDALERFFFATLPLERAQVQADGEPLAAQLRVHAVLPVLAGHVDGVSQVEPPHLFPQVTLVIDRPGRAVEMNVESTRIAAALATGPVQAEAFRRAESGSEPVGMCLARADHTSFGKLVGNGCDSRAGDHCVSSPLGGVHLVPVAEVGAAAPEGKHVVGAAGVGTAAHAVRRRPLGGAARLAGDAAYLVVGGRHGWETKGAGRVPPEGQIALPGTRLRVGNA